jgi:hypothetical protein
LQELAPHALPVTHWTVQQFPVPEGPQKPLAHCGFELQAPPGETRHVLLGVHWYPVMQSVLWVHDTLQFVVPHL